MDYFQGVVTEYLRADRSLFINTEYLIQLEEGDPPTKGRHWYCDAMAISFREKTVYLCEVTYSITLHALITRSQGWNTHWPLVRDAIARDSDIPKAWQIQPLLFIPKKCRDVLIKKLPSIGKAESNVNSMPKPKVIYLESVTPWEHVTWNRKALALADDV